MTARIPLYQSLIEDEELEAAREALQSGWLGMGTLVGDFERAVEKVLGGERIAVGVSTGSAALHLAMLSAGVGPGDEVIVPALCHLSDVQAVMAVGADPVLCDVEDAKLCLDPARVLELVGPRTKAIVALDYACHLADHKAIAALADGFGLRVIHDAAHSFGSFQGEDAVGSFSDLCAFSFDPVKALTCIDGGVVVVQSEAEAERLAALRILGASHPAELAYSQERAWSFDVGEEGFRYHLSNVHAAVGLAQLAKLDRIRASRQAACRIYAERLGAVDGLRVPAGDVDGLNPFVFYVRVRGGSRDGFRRHLARSGVETGIHWMPVHKTTRYGVCRRGELPVTDVAGSEIVSLPLHSGMSEDLVHRVCDAIESFPSAR